MKNGHKKSPESDSELFKVEVARFELATSWSQTRRDNQATLHLELLRVAKIV